MKSWNRWTFYQIDSEILIPVIFHSRTGEPLDPSIIFTYVKYFRIPWMIMAFDNCGIVQKFITGKTYTICYSMTHGIPTCRSVKVLLGFLGEKALLSR